MARRAHDLHAALRERGVTVDVVPPGTDLAGYGCRGADALPVHRCRPPRLVAAACEAGATGADVLLGDRRRARPCPSRRLPRGLQGASRRTKRGVLPMPAGEPWRLDDGLVAAPARVVRAVGLTTRRSGDSFVDGPVPGIPAVTRTRVGAAAAWYVATRLDEAAIEALVASSARRGRGEARSGPPAAGLEAPVAGPRRSDAAGFVLNHATRTAASRFPWPADLVHARANKSGRCTWRPAT